MGCGKENVITAKMLQSGEKCIVQGFGQSMDPIKKSGQKCEVLPVMDDTALEKGDVVMPAIVVERCLQLPSAAS